MGLTTKNKKDFETKLRDTRAHGENIIFVKGGSVVVDDRWTQYNDLQLDVRGLISRYVQTTSRRLFNHFNDILYVLIVRNKNGTVEVVPSLSYNKTKFGNIKIFPNLSGKMPLVLVRVRQDGSAGLTGFEAITSRDIEVYRGYGNFTLGGSYGASGPFGWTGDAGLTGLQGFQGPSGLTGTQGFTGALSEVFQGETGAKGAEGAAVPAHIAELPSIIQDVVDENDDAWYDTQDDTEDQVQDTV